MISMFQHTYILLCVMGLSWTSGDPIVRQISEPVEHGEGPHWDQKQQILYFVDTSGFGFHSYRPKTQEHTSITLGSTVGVAIPIENNRNKFVVGLGRNVSVLTWDGLSTNYQLEHIYTVDEDKPKNRFNDGKADPKGRLWIGTVGPDKAAGVEMNQASLFILYKHCTLEKVLSPVSISNGLAWNRQNNIMYYIDSPTRKIDAFDYSLCNGKIENRRTHFDLDHHNITGVPDGMTIDTEDNLWIAIWGGSRVLKVSPRGELLQTVWFPVERVTSCTFGGEDLRTLYVTTMKTGLTPDQLAKQPQAGSLFAVEQLGVTGTDGREAAACLADPNRASRWLDGLW